ncbi:hypothetical protein BJ912DRAFT_1149027, partial [Pholiota molesta]
MPHEHHDGCGHESTRTTTTTTTPHSGTRTTSSSTSTAPTSSPSMQTARRRHHQALAPPSDEAQYLESDADDQLIIRVPFTGTVRLKAILLKAGPAGQTPPRSACFRMSQRSTLMISKIVRDAGDVVPQSRESASTLNSPIYRAYPIHPGRTRRRHNTNLLPRFLGTWTQAKNQPIITVYEAQLTSRTTKRYRDGRDMECPWPLALPTIPLEDCNWKQNNVSLGCTISTARSEECRQVTAVCQIIFLRSVHPRSTLKYFSTY